MLNIFKFLDNKQIHFANQKKALNWIRNLKPQTLVRIGESYFADEKELDQLLESYIAKQIALRKKMKTKRADIARKNFRKKSGFSQFIEPKEK